MWVNLTTEHNKINFSKEYSQKRSGYFSENCNNTFGLFFCFKDLNILAMCSSHPYVPGLPWSLRNSDVKKNWSLTVRGGYCRVRKDFQIWNKIMFTCGWFIYIYNYYFKQNGIPVFSCSWFYKSNVFIQWYENVKPGFLPLCSAPMPYLIGIHLSLMEVSLSHHFWNYI